MSADTLSAALARLGRGLDLTHVEAHAAVTEVIGGAVPEPLVAAFLTALRMKGETAAELAGAVRAVRERMTPLVASEQPLASGPLLDTCGTGGDGACTVNISTATALVVATCGVPVAKHGNRSASGNSGSAEVLTELGLEIESPVEALRASLGTLGIAFLFAPRFHPALRHVAAVRKLLPFRTLFNLVGPLANPARPTHQLLGVSDLRLLDLVASALLDLGVERAAVVSASTAPIASAAGPGIDEVALDRPTHVRLVTPAGIRCAAWHPEDFGLPRVPVEALRVSGPVESAAILRAVLRGERIPARDVILANSSAALLIAEEVDDLAAGTARAAEALDSGAVAALLERWRTFTRGDS